MLKVLMAVLLLLTACSTGSDVKLAQERVVWFHQMLDAGRYEAIYSATDQTTSLAQLSGPLEELHQRMGATKSSRPTSWDTAYHLNSVEITMKQETVFQQGSATETFVIRIEEGVGRIVGYQLASKRVF